MQKIKKIQEIIALILITKNMFTQLTPYSLKASYHHLKLQSFYLSKTIMSLKDGRLLVIMSRNYNIGGLTHWPHQSMVMQAEGMCIEHLYQPHPLRFFLESYKISQQMRFENHLIKTLQQKHFTNSNYNMMWGLIK